MRQVALSSLKHVPHRPDKFHHHSGQNSQLLQIQVGLHGRHGIRLLDKHLLLFFHFGLTINSAQMFFGRAIP